MHVVKVSLHPLSALPRAHVWRACARERETEWMSSDWKPFVISSLHRGALCCTVYRPSPPLCSALCTHACVCACTCVCRREMTLSDDCSHDLFVYMRAQAYTSVVMYLYDSWHYWIATGVTVCECVRDCMMCNNQQWWAIDCTWTCLCTWLFSI